MSKPLSDCCGAVTKVGYRSDAPFYDDPYDLLIRVLVCTHCGRMAPFTSAKPNEDKKGEDGSGGPIHKEGE